MRLRINTWGDVTDLFWSLAHELEVGDEEDLVAAAQRMREERDELRRRLARLVGETAVAAEGRSR